MNNTEYTKMTFCSNTLINVKKLISINGFIPLIITKDIDDTPLVKLQVNDNNNGELIIVDNNQKQHPFIEVNNSKNQKLLEINFKNQNDFSKILSINYSTTPINIDFIDLRTMGINIIGDSKGLNIGSQSISNSTFESDTFIYTNN